MINSFITAWKKAFDIKGKTSRKDFWFYQLVSFLLFLALNVTQNIVTNLQYAALGDVGNETYSIFAEIFAIIGQLISIFSFLLILGSIIVQFSISVRRLRDIQKKWTWIFIQLIPIFGWLYFELYLMTRPSRYGIQFDDSIDQKPNKRKESTEVNNKKNIETYQSSENTFSSLKKSFAKLTTEFPASETIKKIESLYSLSSQKAEEIYKNTIDYAKKNNRVNPLLSDFNEILKSSSLSELVYSRNGNLVKKDKNKKEVMKKTIEQKASYQKNIVENSAPKNVIDTKPKDVEVSLEKVNSEDKEEKSLKQKLEDLKELFDQNLISEEEYSSLKSKLLDL
tara:strand:+ start:517 stop:1530 length:1014 start_codon:yes stop_codon:yes gene_type:complete